jgi:hypothetical protein
LHQGVGDAVVHVQSGVDPGGGELIRVGFARWELEPGRHHVPLEQEFGDAASVRQPLVPGGRRRQFQPPAAAQGLPQVAACSNPGLSHRLRVLRLRTIGNSVIKIFSLANLIDYFFFSFDDESNTTVVSCVHVLSRDEFYWTNIISFVFYYNSPVVLIMCFLVFSYQLQQNKTSEWMCCFKEITILFAAQV